MRLLLPISALLFVSLTLTSNLDPGSSQQLEKASSSPAADSSLEDVCATGCAAEPELATGLEREQLEHWLRFFGENGDEEALDHLLFHAQETRSGLDTLDHDLSLEKELELRRELARTHAYLDVRLIDEHGVERLKLGRERIPLGEKQHLHPARTVRIASPEVSGAVQRVGREYLWARL